MRGTLCLFAARGSLFAKNSDRPVSRAPVAAAPTRHVRRAASSRPVPEHRRHRRHPVVLSQPTWLWGAEHGVNACHVAIGNEKVYGTSDPYAAPPALIGMDLVRLGLERGRNAEEAIDVMTALLERHGQGGIADAVDEGALLVVVPRRRPDLCMGARDMRAHLGGEDPSSRRRRDLQPADDPHRLDTRFGRRGTRMRTSTSGATRTHRPVTPTGAWRRAGRISHSASAVRPRARRLRARSPHLRDHGSGPWGAPGRSRCGDGPAYESSRTARV